MRKPSALVLIPSGVLLAVLSGPPGAIPAGTDLAAPARLGATPASSGTQSAAAQGDGDHRSLASVSSVTVQNGEPGKTWVDIATTVPTAYHVELMDHPWRVVVDMKDSQDRTAWHTYSVQSSVLTQVRVQQYRNAPGSHVVRVVAVLDRQTSFDVQRRLGGVRIELENGTTTNAVAPLSTARGGPSAPGPAAKPSAHLQETASVQPSASSSARLARGTKPGVEPSKAPQSNAGSRTKAPEQPIVQSKVTGGPVPPKPGLNLTANAPSAGGKATPQRAAKVVTLAKAQSPVASPSLLGLKSSGHAAELPPPTRPPVPAKSAPAARSQGQLVHSSSVEAKAKPPLVAKVATPSTPESRLASPSASAAKPTARPAVPAQPAYEPVPSQSGPATAPKPGPNPPANTAGAGGKATPALVANAATPSRPASRVASPSPLGTKPTARRAVATQSMHESVPAKSGPTALPQGERADTSSSAAGASRSPTAGPPPRAMVQVATSSGSESRVVSPASPKPAIPPGGTTSPVPALQVAPAQTPVVARLESQRPGEPGAIAASHGQSFGPEPIAQVAALVPAREAPPANPGLLTQSNGPILQRAASGGGSVPAQPESQNPPASGQASAPSTGSQAITLVPEASAPPNYSGELVSMNLKDVDLKDFFRMIHEVSGLNIVIDSGITGAVTMILDKVPWDQALDLVLRDNGLGRVLEGNVLHIAKVETLEKEQADKVKLKHAREAAEPLMTVIIPLRYASPVDRTPTQATVTSAGGAGGAMGGAGGGGGTSQQQNIVIPGVVSILQGRVSSGGSSGGGGGGGGGCASGGGSNQEDASACVLSKRGSAFPDTRNNSIILTDIPSRIPLIESVIAKLDTPAKQVSIEARIVVANSDFVRSIQSALNFGSTNPSGTTATGAATGTGATAQGNVPGSASGGTTPPRLTIGQTSASGFGAFAISNQSMRYFINAAISAAETRDQAKTISAPTVVTQNNWPAVVMQGVQIPIQTTINNTISTQFVDAALTLQVTPTVTEGGHLFLQLQVANNSVGAVLTGAAGPSINTQAATTVVMVPDGGTVVFGGVKVTSRTRSVTQVPVLGDLPLLGNLFKSSNFEDNDQELLFFVSPKILPE